MKAAVRKITVTSDSLHGDSLAKETVEGQIIISITNKY